MTLFLLFLISSEWNSVDYQGFRSVSFQTFAMLPDGDFVILDVDENSVYQFSPEGQVRKVLATKGRGPNEIMGAYALDLLKEILVIKSAGWFFLIDLKQGNMEVVNTYKLKVPGFPLRVENGWFFQYTKTEGSHPVESLKQFDLKLKLKKVIYEKKLPEYWDRARYVSHTLERTYMPERSFLHILPGGDTLVYRHASENIVKLIDTNSGEVRKQIEIKSKPFPIDKAKAKREIADWKKNARSSQLNYHIPDVYPVIDSITLLSERRFCVSTKANNKLGKDFFVFNEKGEPVQVSMWIMDFFKILGTHGDWYYVGHYDEPEDIYEIHRVHKDHWVAYLKAHPHPYLDKYRDKPLE